MFGMKKVIMCLNNLDRQIQMMNVRMEEKFEALDVRMEAVEEKLEALDVRMEAVEEKLEALDVRVEAVEEKLEALDVRMEVMESKISALDEKVDMVEYHLSKEVELTYQAVLENKRNIVRLSHRLDESLTAPVRKVCPVPV